MARRTIVIAVSTAALLVAAPPAFALHKDETATSGQTTATFSYDYKKNRYGF